MKAIDTRGQFPYLKDQSRRIPAAMIRTVCKIHEKEKTCKYIVLINSEYVCVNGTPLAISIDEMASQNKTTARSINCNGLGNKNEDKENKEKRNEEKRNEEASNKNEEINKRKKCQS